MVVFTIRFICTAILTAAPAVVSLSDLYFVKTRDAGSGQVEVHTASPNDNYGSATGHFVSGYSVDEGKNGDFTLDSGVLYFIKTRNTGAGALEVYSTTKASSYETISLHSGTVFSLSDAENGVWNVDDGGFYLVKTGGTGSGHVEVYRAGPGKWDTLKLHAATTIPQDEGEDGTWVIYRGDLFFMKYGNTRGNNVEVHVIQGGSGNYGGQPTAYTTSFDVRDGGNGIWDIGINRDLYFIKTRNTGSGHVEVHIASASSQYRDINYYTSWISEGDGPDRAWCVD